MKLKHASKRIALRKKYKIEKKVKEHHKKLRKAAKSLGLTHRKKSDLFIPGEYPHKREVLEARLTAQRNQGAELDEKRRSKRKEKRMKNKLYLGSSSKVRREILEKAGYHVECCPSNVDESLSEPPTTTEERVVAITNRKTDAVVANLKNKLEAGKFEGGEYTCRFVVCCDTIGYGTKIGLMEKPKNMEQALEFIEDLHTGRKFGTWTCVEVFDLMTGNRAHKTEEVVVHFKLKPFPELHKRREYIERSGALNASGAVIIEDPFFAKNIAQISGNLGGMMGISPTIVKDLIDQLIDPKPEGQAAQAEGADAEGADAEAQEGADITNEVTNKE